MSRWIFILGSPNSPNGILSPISHDRVALALAEQRRDPNVILFATGGFGTHFNVTDTPHRELVHRYLEEHRAAIDRGDPGDLLSANTVEDILLIAKFASARSVTSYGIVTSDFHVRRCRYILNCLAPTHSVALLAAGDDHISHRELIAHEERALAGLIGQGGVMIGTVLHPVGGRRYSDPAIAGQSIGLQGSS